MMINVRLGKVDGFLKQTEALYLVYVTSKGLGRNEHIIDITVHAGAHLLIFNYELYELAPMNTDSINTYLINGCIVIIIIAVTCMTSIYAKLNVIFNT